ncbi:MAG: hypothetical protein H6617_04060 [Bdellovibrionaceae bacterium]|nr:hypothetical protein [Bdellovibrionales bacterium]MCB9253833.1 hypothetical protein [Pseudobdellovibrionaceae bacterium]
MLSAILQFVAAGAVIFLAGAALTRFADVIADLTKMGRLLAGSVLLASATSLPELIVDVSAARSGLLDLAVGDLMGSSLCNLFILAVLDIVSRPQLRALGRASTSHALAGVASISLAAVAALSILLGPRLAPFEVGSVGVGSIALLITYLFGLRLVFFDQRLEPAGAKSSSPPMHLSAAVFGYLATAGLILLAAPYLVRAAAQIATSAHIGTTFVGTTMVALSTSLPELVTTRAALKRGASDLAIGNVLGSNAFNMVILVALDFVVEGPVLSRVSSTHALTAICTIFVTTIAIMSQLYRLEKRKILVEPDAYLVLILVLASLGLVFWIG